MEFIGKNYKLPQSIKDDCNWHYAMVICKVDKNNRVVNYRLINEDATIDLVNSFGYLKNYVFPKTVAVGGKTLLFCFTIENHKENCKIPKNRFYTPSEITGKIYNDIANQLRKDQNTILLEPAIGTEVYDRSY
jgi:hypothetical protein